MSSAATQAAPHLATVAPTLSPIASSGNRSYGSQSSQSRDQYYSQPSSNASPPTTTSAGRHTRRPSGNGATSNLDQQMNSMSLNTSEPRTSRQASTSSQRLPSTAMDSAPSMLPTTAPVDYQRGNPPTAPPRTSSNQRSTSSATDRARRADQILDERAQGSRRANAGDSQQSNRQVNGVDRDTTGGDATTSSSRTRRRVQPEPSTSQAQRTSSRETRQSQPAVVPVRSQARTSSYGPTTNGLSREGSEIIKREIISKPEVDLERERERQHMAETHSPATSRVAESDPADDASKSGSRSRHDNTASSSKREKNTKFGEYYLGNTLGEGEFGKVKMGWKQEGGVQVAIKLIRRDSVGTNPTRLAKIYREIAILREISHPNIVRLHEMVETEKHIGIILEYASGGELFDYILNHRYLKDPAARKLFAQLVSGVGYLHKKGIVHRDLKLENLLLDRNRNIIITDFGFANTFNPSDELGEELEYGLSSREFVKKNELDKILPNGFRRGDLMQTSCGSPCYAAPELVVSDSLYTGRKVDVWSCGVILYAMLAGYLPFDDDPANPEGDNINLLYKYIVSTPLTFPEYVTPHARDLLRRILVPDPRHRADLFEVARHSWLSEYADVVGFITSSTSTPGDIATTTVASDVQADVPLLARSASVREPTKTQRSPVAGLGDLGRKHGTVEQGSEETYKTPKDAKRRTVQVEYVAPRSETVRGQDASVASSSGTRNAARSASQGPVEVSREAEKALPEPPRSSHSQYASQSMRPPSSGKSATRPVRDPPRSASDTAYMSVPAGASIARPTTGGSMDSRGSMGLTSRGSYGQPVAPTVAGTNAQGHFSQPTTGKRYVISNPIPMDGPDMEYGRPSISQVPPKFAKVAGFADAGGDGTKGHKRSNTVTGRIGSFFGGKSDKGEKQKKYPPVSMTGAVGVDNHRQSMDSTRRSISFGFGRKRSGSITGSAGNSTREKPRRFSQLLPTSFSLKAIGIGKDYGTPHDSREEQPYYPDGPNDSEGYLAQPGRGQPSANYGPPGAQAYNTPTATPPLQSRYATAPTQSYDGHLSRTQTQQPAHPSRIPVPQHPSSHYPPPGSQPSEPYGAHPNAPLPNASRYPQGFNTYDGDGRPTSGSKNGRGVLQKNNRRFNEAYEAEPKGAGSSGAARKVMDFFRRRGKARGEGL